MTQTNEPSNELTLLESCMCVGDREPEAFDRGSWLYPRGGEEGIGGMHGHVHVGSGDGYVQ